MDELKNKKEETNKEIEEKKQKEQEAKNSITTNSQLLKDLTKDAWGYLESSHEVITYMSFDDSGTVYFAVFSDSLYGNYGTVKGELNHGEYAIDEDKSEIIMFYPNSSGRIDESHVSYKYENGQLMIEGDRGIGWLDGGENYIVEYINDESFVDFYKTVVLEGNEKGQSVSGFYRNHPDLIREERLL